jgi:hypothetical protein
MTMREFAELVHETRAAQRRYYGLTLRTPALLAEIRRLEMLLDQAVADVLVAGDITEEGRDVKDG